jgi:hypothetical protein
LNLKWDLLVSRFAFKWVNMYRYAAALMHSNHLDKCREGLAALKALRTTNGAATAALVEVGLYKLNPVDP